MQGNEAWAEIRRTGFPKFLVKPGDIVWADAPAEEKDKKFIPLAGNGIPSRIYYPQKEQAVNLENYREAVGQLTGDKIDAQVWWNK